MPVSLAQADISVFLQYILVIFIGALLGSFSTALIYRIPRKISWSLNFQEPNKGPASIPRSSCACCGRILAFIDLIPLISWIAAKGRCRYCGQRIGWVYPVAELTAIAACLGIYAVFGFSAEAFLGFACIPFLIALFFIDMEYMILPNQLIAWIAGLGILRLALKFYAGNSVYELLQEYIFGALVFGFLSWLTGQLLKAFLKKEALGFGDVKFFAVAGLWLGLKEFGIFCIGAGILGLCLALAWRLFGKGSVFPFGPALILTFYFLFILHGSLFY